MISEYNCYLTYSKGFLARGVTLHCLVAYRVGLGDKADYCLVGLGDNTD